MSILKKMSLWNAFLNFIPKVSSGGKEKRVISATFKCALTQPCIYLGEILSGNEKYAVRDNSLNEFTVRSRLIIKNFDSSDVGMYTCVGRNVFNNKGDREEGKIAVNFVKGMQLSHISMHDAQ